MVPDIHALTDHDAKDANEPHLRTAVLTRFELVVDLLSIVGALCSCPSFVDPFGRKVSTERHRVMSGIQENQFPAPLRIGVLKLYTAHHE